MKNNINYIIKNESLNRIITMESDNYKWPDTISHFDYYIIAICILVCILLILLCMFGVIV